jgi:CHASE1-domain containing sensor protein
MDKKLLISLVLVGGAIYLYYNSRKNKATQNADAATKENSERLKSKIKSDIPLLIARSPKDATTGTNDIAKSMFDRLSRTIDANLMSVDELQKVADAMDAKLDRYVGTKSIQQIGNEANEVLGKYQIGGN